MGCLFFGSHVTMIFRRGQQSVLVADHHKVYFTGVSLIFRQRLARVPGVVGKVSASQPNRRLHHELATTAEDIVGKVRPGTPVEHRLLTRLYPDRWRICQEERVLLDVDSQNENFHPTIQVLQPLVCLLCNPPTMISDIEN